MSDFNPPNRLPRTRRGRTPFFVMWFAALALLFVACGSDTVPATGDDTTAATSTTEGVVEDSPSEPAEIVMEPEVSVRDSGLTLTVIPFDGVTVHALTAPEEVFANSTYVLELENSLVLIDTQFLLPNAADMRAYADSLGKPIDRMFITHEHPDHFLGSEVFADIPVFALAEVSEEIAANGDAEVEEKQGDFGAEAIAGSFVTPEVVEPGSLEIDGVTFELERVVDAEAHVQLVVRLPEVGVIAVGDIVYSGVHLIMAGAPDTWTAALEDLQATSDEYPAVLPGHGVPTDASAYAANVAWLAKAGELIATVDNAEAFKQGLVDEFPELGMDAAIDFVIPFLFPESADGVSIPDPELSVRDSGLTVRVYPLDGVTVHTLTAPVEVFANTTYVLETEKSLVLVDTQFLLPNAADMRAYADSLGKPIDRMFITHEHPDHFLGSEVFADVPIFALAEVAERIAEIGDAEIEEKQADFGPDAIASSFVAPESVEPGTIEVDGLTLELGRVLDAEAPVQLTLKLPGTGAILVGDIVYSGVHLIMAGAPDTWTVALEDLQATADEYPLVLPGHGDPTDPSEYDVNIEWLTTAGELIGSVDNADDFRQGLIDAFPGRPMESAIDFVIPFLFPES